MLYQYFVDIVPTEVKTFLSRLTTYQYSVKDHERPIDHHKGSHGIPGIFFKYDVSALKVRVTQERDSPIQFIVRLCATIAGICVISGECDEIRYSRPFFLLSDCDSPNMLPSAVHPLCIQKVHSNGTVE